jgi:tetratricopeptide (TPR) repeat protein/predicted Ser/Thr protein kinase
VPREHETRDEFLMSLVDAGLELPGAERETRLRQSCPDDPALLQEVLKRIDWELEMRGFLTEPVLRIQDPAEFVPGQMLGPQLRIVRKIAEGGMAVVYEAQDARIDRVAVKIPKPAYRRRVINEARLALQVTHPNICRVHGVETAHTELGEIDFLTMEYLAGETLQERIRRGPLSKKELATLAAQLCAGLAEAHGRGIVHGDLKGSNVILAEREGSFRAVITDFGLARTHDTRGAAIAASVRGTPDFLAPELWDGQAFSVASDFYALGVLLYEAATGARPFSEDPSRRKGSPLVPADRLRKDLPRRWSRAIGRCLSLRPEDRPADVASVARAFQPYWSASPGTLGLFAFLVLLAGAAGMTIRWQGLPSEPIRIAVLPIDADSESMAWGGGALHQASTLLVGFRGPHGPVVIVPPAKGAGTDAESLLKSSGATHLLKARFRRAGNAMQADLTIRNARTGDDLKTFSGTYTSASLGALPEALVAAVTSALQLTNGPRQPRMQARAWPDYLRGEGELQKPNPDFDVALAAFQSAVQIDPEASLPWAGTATALERKYKSRNDPKLLDLAREAMREAVSRDPDGIGVHLAAGSVYKDSGLPEKAAAEYSRVLQLEPGNVEAMSRLAESYSDMQLPDQAVQTWQQAMSQLPQYYQSYLDLGQFYYYHSRYADAAAQFLKVTQLAPGLAMGHHDLGAAYNDLGRFAEAEKAFRDALAIREHSDTLIGLGSVMDYQHRLDEAVSYYERARQVGPVTYLLLADLGDAYRRVKRTVDARQTYQEALSYADRDLLERPRDGYIRAFVAYLCARLDDKVRAQREVEQALRFNPDETKVKRTAIRTLAVLGKLDEAHTILESEPALQDEMKRHPDASEFLPDSRSIR